MLVKVISDECAGIIQEELIEVVSDCRLRQ